MLRVCFAGRENVRAPCDEIDDPVNAGKKKSSRAETLLRITQSYEVLRYAYASHCYVSYSSVVWIETNVGFFAPTCSRRALSSQDLDHVT